MTAFARTTRPLARLLVIAFIVTLLTGCNEDNTTNDSLTGPAAGNSSGMQRPHQPTPAELAAQAEQYANRLDQHQHAPSPYPATPRLTDDQRTKPPEVQWLDPHAAPADPGGTDSSAPASAPDSNTHTTASPAATAPAALSREEQIKHLAADLKPMSAAQSTAVRPWLRRASLAVIDPSYELSADDMKTLAPEDRQLVLAWQRTFAELGRSLGSDAKTDRATLIDLADELHAQLQEQRHLAVTTMKLCTRVNGYGVYDAIDKPVFLAGTEHPVIVYAELENFRTKVDDRKHHLVQLSQEMVLYNDADGLPVWRQRPVAINDESANQRRDFFTVQVIHLSDRLSVGKYILKLRVTDQIGAAVAESSLPLQIVADPKLINEK